ncbi:MAG: UDP-glucose dehydrogenase family protein [Gemmobacter sp.]|jgi:UDPglucose 6-dehydrogenase
MRPGLSVFGLGKLGAPMLAVFAHKGFDVIGTDLNPAFVDAINDGRAPVEEPGLAGMIAANRARIRATLDPAEAVAASDASFIIVPTPSGPDGFFRNDYLVSALEAIGRAIRAKAGYHLVVVTSTVMPGATGGILRETLERASGRRVGPDLGLCYNPEFIALGTVVRDMLNPDMILIGQSDAKAGDMLEAIYRQSVESRPDYQRMNWVNAELCKIAVNTYVTTKISYANMIAGMCDRLPGADADVVTHALGADSRIGRKYIKGAIAYGGPCFPRDNKAFAALGRSLGVRTDLAEATDAINAHQTERLVAAVAALAAPGAEVAILGLSYKPHTPVIEESQGLALARALGARGYRLRLSDPAALAGLPADATGATRRCASAAEAIAGADVAVIMTPWPEYRDLPLGAPGAPAAVIDPWRMLDPAAVPAGITLLRLGALAQDPPRVAAARKVAS